MATIKQILLRKFEMFRITSDKEEVEIATEIVRDFACKFVLYLDNTGVDEKLSLNEALEEFEKYYDKTTDISGNEIKQLPNE